MDGLARDPDRLTTPHNTDTGETILHLLAKVYRKWHSMLTTFTNITNKMFVIIFATKMF